MNTRMLVLLGVVAVSVLLGIWFMRRKPERFEDKHEAFEEKHEGFEDKHEAFEEKHEGFEEKHE